MTWSRRGKNRLGGGRHLEQLDPFANGKVTPVDLLGASVVLRVVGEVDRCCQWKAVLVDQPGAPARRTINLQ
eukprot:387443-Pleurochrysis_carterae.AAC.3